MSNIFFLDISCRWRGVKSSLNEDNSLDSGSSTVLRELSYSMFYQFNRKFIIINDNSQAPKSIANFIKQTFTQIQLMMNAYINFFFRPIKNLNNVS